MTSSRLLLSVAVLVAPSLSAQSDKPDLASAETQVRAALEKTKAAGTLTFKTIESHDDAMMRRLSMPGREDVQVSGVCGGGMLYATIGFDDDEVLFANGRMVARPHGGTWKLRRGHLAGGAPLPFVLDPFVMLTVLAAQPAGAIRVVHVEPSKIKDQDVTVYGLLFAGAQAEELTLSGLLPSAGGPMMVHFIGAHSEGPKAELSVDMAITVDAHGHIVRVQSKLYSKSDMPGNFAIRVDGPNGTEVSAGDEEAEEEEVEKPATEPAALTFSKGIPKRVLNKKTSLTELDVTFSQHSTAKVPELNAATLALLGGK